MLAASLLRCWRLPVACVCCVSQSRQVHYLPPDTCLTHPRPHRTKHSQATPHLTLPGHTALILQNTTPGLVSMTCQKISTVIFHLDWTHWNNWNLSLIVTLKALLIQISPSKILLENVLFVFLNFILLKKVNTIFIYLSNVRVK